VSLALLVTGLVLVRFGFFELRDPRVRGVAYWFHALLPLAAASLYMWHRERGGRFRRGRAWASFGGVAALSAALGLIHAMNPHPKSGTPKEGEPLFSPSLARTGEGRLLPLRVLTMNDYCKTCHADAYHAWSNSAHRFSSFNNQFCLASVKETRKVVQERDGNARQPLVRRMSRPGSSAQRDVRHRVAGRTDRTDRPAGITMHGVSRDHAGEQHARQRRLPDRGAASVSLRVQHEPVSAIPQPATGESQTGVPPAHFPPAGASHDRILLGVPQGASRRT
jgi:hypothetical protein